MTDLTTRLAVSINDDGSIKSSLSPTFVNLTLSGDLNVNGNDILSTGAINIKCSGQSTAYLSFSFPGGVFTSYPSVNSSYKFGYSSKVWLEGWFDKIASDGDLTLDPGGNDVILSAAHLQIQDTYTLKHIGTSDQWTETFNNEANTGWSWGGAHDVLSYHNAGVEVFKLDDTRPEAPSGIIYGSWSLDAVLNDVTHGTGTRQLFVGTYTIDVTAPSDERFKQNIVDTKHGLNDLLKIEVKDYKYKKEIMADDKTVHTGIIANQLDAVYPHAVTTAPWGEKEIECNEEEAQGEEGKLKEKYRKRENKYYRLEPRYTNVKTIDYKKLIPLLIKSVQELAAKTH